MRPGQGRGKPGRYPRATGRNRADVSLVHSFEGEQVAGQVLPSQIAKRRIPIRRKDAALDVVLDDAILDAKAIADRISAHTVDDVSCCFHGWHYMRKNNARNPLAHAIRLRYV